MPGANQYYAQQFIDAIPGTGGIITAIAKKVGCDWHTAKKYIVSYTTVNRAYQDECEKVLDLAESKTIEMIHASDGQMIRYYLSTKGKHRGYTERQELKIEVKELDSAIERELARVAVGGKAEVSVKAAGNANADAVADSVPQ